MASLPDTILKVLDDPAAPPILTRADGFTFSARSSGELLQSGVRPALCCVSRSWDRSASTGLSANTFATGRTSIRLRPTFSAPWRARAARIFRYFWRGWFIEQLDAGHGGEGH